MKKFGWIIAVVLSLLLANGVLFNGFEIIKSFLTTTSAKADNTAYFLPEYVNMPSWVRCEYQDIREGEDIVSINYDQITSWGWVTYVTMYGSRSYYTMTVENLYVTCCEKVQENYKKCDHNQTMGDDKALAACQQNYMYGAI